MRYFTTMGLHQHWVLGEYGRILSKFRLHFTDYLQFLRWQIITAFDIIIELALLGVASYIVGALQLSKYKKSIVIFAFALRLP
jgi:hypothetical protein